MIRLRFAPLVLKQIVRRPARSWLTVAGVGAAMFLFVAVETLNRSVTAATTTAASDTSLIVFRKDRFCPATSRLPEYYAERIARIEGVTEVVPQLIVTSNCGAALDVITYRGVPPDAISALASRWEVSSGSLQEWRRRSDAAVVGERLAQRRGFQVGDSFESSGIRATIAAVIRSSEPAEQDVAYVDLQFLQQAAGNASLGLVTRFAVRVDEPGSLETVAEKIDEDFRHDEEPTRTAPEKAFLAQAAADVVALVGFTHLLGWGSLIAVLGLISNAIVMSVRERVREHAVLQTVGYRPGLIGRLILVEGLLLGLIGGGLGAASAALLVHQGRFTLAAEGLQLPVALDPAVVGLSLLVSAAVGIVAGLTPAVMAGRRRIVDSLRDP